MLLSDLLKRSGALTAGLVLVVSASLFNVQAAWAMWWGHYEVHSTSATCLSMWDHIDQYGRPYGTKKTLCSGTFPTNVDWDMVCWPYGYKLKYWARGTTAYQYDSTSDHCHKFHDFSDVYMKSMK